MFRDFDQSTLHDTSSVISAAHNKDYYKKNKISGLYKDYDPITGDLLEEGEFSYGKEVGLWKVLDEDGDQQHFRYREERIGARCSDGSFSSATGRGACSWHGGVSQWLYDNKRYQVGGTGKYQPIEERVKRTKDRLKDQMKINIIKNDQELFLEVANKLLKQNPNPELQEKQLQQQLTIKINTIKSEYESRLSELQQIQQIIEAQNLKLKEDNQRLNEKLADDKKPTQNHEQIIQIMKNDHDEQLKEKNREIENLRNQLSKAKTKEEKNQKKLDLSASRSDTENYEIKNQIKLIQQQLALLNQTVESKQRKQDLSYAQSDQDVSDKQSDKKNSEKSRKKQSALSNSTKKEQHKLVQLKKPSPKVQTDPKQSLKFSKEPLTKPLKELESLDTSQQSSIIYDKNQQPNLNDSLSYSKILNSKLFKDQNNRSDLSMFVDLKQSQKSENATEKKDKKFGKVLETSKYDQKRTYRFKPEEQSSDEEDEVTLRTDSEDESSGKEEENSQIFRSIPFKSDKSEIISKDGKTVKDKK